MKCDNLVGKMERVKVNKRFGHKGAAFSLQECMRRELDTNKGGNVRATIYRNIIKKYNACESVEYNRQAALAKERVLLANKVTILCAAKRWSNSFRARINMSYFQWIETPLASCSLLASATTSVLK